MKKAPLHIRLEPYFKNHKKSYDINTRQRYRRLMKNIHHFSTFYTIKKKENKITNISNEGIAFITNVSKKANFIKGEKIKQALRHVFYSKTTSCKELEPFSNFTSALMGILHILLYDISQFCKTPSGLLRLTIKGCRYFFSGFDKASEVDWLGIIRNKVEFILVSYYHVRDKSLWENLKRIIHPLGIKVLLDSGAFSVFSQKEEILNGKSSKKIEDIQEIDIYEYANFIDENSDFIYGFMNLDVIGNSTQTQKNYQLLSNLTKKKPIPVWHCNINNWKDSDWDLLEEIYQQDHSVIALGATVGLGKKAGPSKQNIVKYEFFKEVFNRYPNQNFHWLGGSTALMFEFPFFSADSQGWRQGRMDKKQLYTLESIEKSTRKGPTSWSKDKCLNFNIKTLSKVEEIREGIQLSIFDHYNFEN